MRTITIPATKVTEAIINTYHNQGMDYYVTVAQGTTDKNGKFIPSNTVEQVNYKITQSLYTDLISKHPSPIEADLWVYIDALRSGATTTAPSPNYNLVKGVWIEDITKAKKSKYNEIEAKRLLSSTANITFKTLSLQADNIAKANIQGKILEIQSSIAIGRPVTNMVWRDANNIEKSWTVEAKYLLWLQELSADIAARDTQAYIDSWTAKSDIDALTVFADIEAYIV